MNLRGATGREPVVKRSVARGIYARSRDTIFINFRFIAAPSRRWVGGVGGRRWKNLARRARERCGSAVGVTRSRKTRIFFTLLPLCREESSPLVPLALPPYRCAYSLSALVFISILSLSLTFLPFSLSFSPSFVVALRARPRALTTRKRSACSPRFSPRSFQRVMRRRRFFDSSGRRLSRTARFFVNVIAEAWPRRLFASRVFLIASSAERNDKSLSQRRANRATLRLRFSFLSVCCDFAHVSRLQRAGFIVRTHGREHT